MNDGDRVRWPAQHGVIGEGTIVGWVGVDGSPHAVIRTDSGKYLAKNLLHLQRVVPAPCRLDMAYGGAPNAIAAE
jgi:hypothetical protein